MKQFPNLTPKRVLRKHREIAKKYPKDRKIYQVIEKGSIGKKEFLGLLRKVV